MKLVTKISRSAMSSLDTACLILLINIVMLTSCFISLANDFAEVANSETFATVSVFMDFTSDTMVETLSLTSSNISFTLRTTPMTGSSADTKDAVTSKLSTCTKAVHRSKASVL
ncbi:hypothetical protein F8203_gp053 [Heliothis virescens ascovirus 3f]|uniref:Uncharacterized protein n=1 Tax=Heliothis virescens ascovirus 3f TaxID=328614 RepID=A0A171PVE7_9VIRU|nr:hypothetical protein F8203_gp053 [Heliothis virescens ascovirus 3f]AJP09019.1 hypothetical protein [Heliothis virescens ascovirus 3f]